jgi:DNA polymerase-1
MQNIPKHGNIIDGFKWSNIRKMFTALDKGWLIGEVDYVGAEVKIAALLTNDSVLIQDLLEDMDMHSHWANVLFGINKDLKIIKKEHPDERFLAKNNFTFANLFGAGFRSIAEEMRKHDFYYNYVQSIWENEGHSGQRWNTFYIEFSEQHIQDCQEEFYKRYKGVKKWQDELIAFYRIHGYIDNPLGFRRRYPLKSTEIINYPIQSTSFLILLHSLVELDDRMIDEELLSHICGQIHDSGFFNIWEEEAYHVMKISKDCLTACHFPWQSKLPLEIEWELGRTWFDLEAVKQSRGRNVFGEVARVSSFDKLEVGERFLFPNNKGGFKPYEKVSLVMASSFGTLYPFQNNCIVRKFN